jgi:hypothetical protein
VHDVGESCSDHVLDPFQTLGTGFQMAKKGDNPNAKNKPFNASQEARLQKRQGHKLE